jgi:magnesium transporter
MCNHLVLNVHSISCHPSKVLSNTCCIFVLFYNNIFFVWYLQLELFLSSGTVCLSLYSLVAGVFGMNIPYTWNDGHGYIFKWVSLYSQYGTYNDALLGVTCSSRDRWFLYQGFFVPLCLSPLLRMRDTRVSSDPE